MALVAAMGPELIYSAYTNKPYFLCPVEGAGWAAVKCALYQATDRWNPLETPILRQGCLPGQTCTLVSLSRPGNSIRWLPGDIWTSAYRFEGWALYEDGQNPYPPRDEKPAEPEPEPQLQVCEKVCRSRSIHGICTGYRLVCTAAA